MRLAALLSSNRRLPVLNMPDTEMQWAYTAAQPCNFCVVVTYWRDLIPPPSAEIPDGTGLSAVGSQQQRPKPPDRLSRFQSGGRREYRIRNTEVQNTSTAHGHSNISQFLVRVKVSRWISTPTNPTNRPVVPNCEGVDELGDGRPHAATCCIRARLLCPAIVFTYLHSSPG